MSGHYAPNNVTNEVWGLSVVDNRYYLSCSDDGTFRVWDAINREQATWISLDYTASLKRRAIPAG
jgi:WD40 repeat protein